MARRFRHLHHLAALVALLSSFVGCVNAERARVHGTVTLNGEKVDGGTISFIAIDSNPPRSAWGKILDGRYDIPEREGAPIGNCRVEIRWPRSTGRKIPALAMASAEELTTEYRESIPAEYNAESTVQVQVERTADDLTFELKSQN